GIFLAGFSHHSDASKYGVEHIAATGLMNPAALSSNPFELEVLRAEYDRANAGLAMSPVPVRAGWGRTRFLIGLGSYLTNSVGGCIDCHTSPTYDTGGDPFRGQKEKINTKNYLAGGARFGPFTSRNLTPDPANGNRPAGLSLDEFLDVMQKGTDFKKLHPQISPLLQVMPWPAYSKMTERDLTAIYYYLSAIPHADPAPAAN
ncbi:MAG: hypothetical protein ACKV2V_24660, partial [Blastocatellia bacterium]